MSPLYLTEADVARLVTTDDAIAAVTNAFAAWDARTTGTLPRQRAALPGGAFNLMGATDGERGVYGVKAYLGGRGYHVMLYAADTAASLGIALEDVAFAEAIYRKALAAGLGKRVA